MRDRDTIGVVLAGGQARRMGGAKAFALLGGETLIARTIARARPQVDALLINANDDTARFAEFVLPVIADTIGGFLGPLAGIFAAMEWVRAHRADARWLASFACDCPFLPLDLVERLRHAAETRGVEAAIAASAGRRHPVFAVWRTDMAGTAQSVLIDQGLRKMDDFLARVAHAEVAFEAEPIDPFFNVNTQDDLARAEAMLRSQR